VGDAIIARVRPIAVRALHKATATQNAPEASVDGECACATYSGSRDVYVIRRVMRDENSVYV